MLVTRSMTGFGSAEKTAEGYTVRVELRTVNHRYNEISLRLPRELLPLEEALKQELKGLVKRGRTEASVFVDRTERLEPQARVNWTALDRYMAAAEEIAKRYGLHSDVSVHHLLSLPDVLLTSPEAEGTEGGILPLLVTEVFRTAADRLVAMREAEGSYLLGDLEERLQLLRDNRNRLADRAPLVVGAYREKLTARLRGLLEDVPVDEQRVAMEAAIFAERGNVDEELTRLASHYAQFESLLRSEEPAGRKLDFLVQEMNREVNTIGSKAGDAEMAAIVVETKAELEKIREQIQNIE
ncbi:YicC/YloC family endoribonuclease [Gorillibacterium sp. sgz500922]|uniref:YicC/YloC family endoribonuclease n=1 Tax=Gorillibacterium sp. sgz500922 TaxID=3446694 RepID=UPI003F67244A